MSAAEEHGAEGAVATIKALSIKYVNVTHPAKPHKKGEQG